MNALHALLEGAGIGLGVTLSFWCLTSLRDILEGILEGKRTCRVCGCSNFKGPLVPESAYFVERDLCSVCAERSK